MILLRWLLYRLFFFFFNVIYGVYSLVFFNIILLRIIAELLLFNLRDGFDVLELSLHVPVFVEEVVVAPQFLSNFTNQMQILLCFKPRYLNIVLLVEYFYIDQFLSCSDSLHESEIEAPDHDDTKDNWKRHHNNPILNIIHIKHFINFILLIAVAVVIVGVDFVWVFILSLDDSVALLEVRVKEEGALGEDNQ